MMSSNIFIESMPDWTLEELKDEFFIAYDELQHYELIVEHKKMVLNEILANIKEKKKNEKI